MSTERANLNEAQKLISENLGMDISDFQDTQPEQDTSEPEDELASQDDEPVSQEEPDDLSAEPEGEQAEQQRQPKQKPLPKSAEVRADQRGNLVNAQGQIVARAGAEARFYKAAHQARQEVERVKMQATAALQDVSSRLEEAVRIGTELHTELQALKNAQSAFQQHGLTPDENLQAIQWMALAKRDPIALGKQLLTYAATRGIDLSQLGLQNGAGLDVRTLTDQIRNEIASQMKPLQERNEVEQRRIQEQQEHQRQLNETARQVQRFLVQNPEARQYLPVFHQVYSDPRFANMSLGEVWARIQLNLLQKQRSNPQMRSMPSGRRAMANGNGQDDIAPIEASYDQIINGVLDKAGFGR